MMECRECRERLSDFLEDDFSSNEASLRADLRSHLETCAACRSELELLQAVRAELRSFAEVTAPSNLRSRVRAQLLQEKPAKTTTKATLGNAFGLPRLALSGGAVLAACCLLLLVRSSPFLNSLTPEEQNSASPTAADFQVPDRAFEETPEEKAHRQAKAKAPKKTSNTERLAKNSNPVARPADSNAALGQASSQVSSGATFSQPDPRNDSAPEAEQFALPLKNSAPTQGNEKQEKGSRELSKEAPVRPRVAKDNGSTTGKVAGQKSQAADSQPNPALTRSENQNAHNDTNVKVRTPQGAVDAAPFQGPLGIKPETTSPPIAAIPSGPQGPRGERGLAGPTGPQGLNTNNSFEAAQTKAKGPLVAEADTAKEAITTGSDAPGNSAARRVAKPSLPLENRAANSAAGTGQDTTSLAGSPAAPAAPLLADAGTAGVQSGNSVQAFAPGRLRASQPGAGHSALTITRAAPAALTTQKADYIIELGTTQVVNLSFVPDKDALFAQLRVTLPSGLRFGDETKAETKQKDALGAKLPEKPASRILWRGAAPKGTPIENAVEIKALAQGRHIAVLTLESLDGKPLQTKNVLFQLEEPNTPENPQAASGETK